MNKAININAGVMLLISIAFTYISLSLIVTNEGNITYDWGFIIGRSLMNVLLPFFIVWLARIVFRRKPMYTKGTFVSWWILFVVLSLVALFGSMLPPEL
ncbi:MAG: hypothetical protein MJK10_01455 [Pseudomonadales bacterium]|nr:hypothetical protein [Pseudomonadales bacterium]NRA14538.1 hypothetical protein [Oceanospirillaceae bacterium]